MELLEITRLCRQYRDALDEKDALSSEIESAQRRVARQKLRSMVALAARISAAEADLRKAVEDSPNLFKRPRTQTLEGIKVGYRKMPGRIEVGDETRAIELVRRKLPDKADLLINVVESLDKNALKNLGVRELATIGATLGEDTDAVAVGVPKSPAGKTLDALIAEGRIDEEDPGTGSGTGAG